MMGAPMGMPQDMNIPNAPMGDMPQDMPSMDEPPMGENPKDEGNTPKKEIQQLTGTISQKLRTYNDTENDSELSKYVAGMIIPQACKAMTDDDKQDIINKIKKGTVSDEETPQDDSSMGMNEPPMDKQPEPKMSMESRLRRTARLVNEIVGSIINDKDEQERVEKKSIERVYKWVEHIITNF
jgi:hypothetical protein